MCSGPGWSNEVVNVLMRDSGTGEMKVECIQPEEHTDVMKILFSISDHVSEKMRKEAEKLFKVRGTDS